MTDTRKDALSEQSRSARIAREAVDALRPAVKLATYTSALREIAASEVESSARRLARSVLYEEDYSS